MGPVDHRGRWVVLVFYPRDLNFVCPTELVELADLTPAFMDEKVSDGSAGRPAAETLRVVRALRTGELRPASRQPGQPYLLAA
jgi:alkyl hydroperoxide reductase subunit AhpC